MFAVVGDGMMSRLKPCVKQMPMGHPVETSNRERTVRHTRLAVRTEGLN